MLAAASSRQHAIVAVAVDAASSSSSRTSSSVRRRPLSFKQQRPSRSPPLLRQTTTTTSTSTAAASASASAAAAAALASTTFSAATVAAVCAYAALVTRPRSRLAAFLTSSPLLPLTGCLTYLLAALLFWPGAVAAAAAAAVAASRPLPSVGAFAALFASAPGATAVTWLHLLAGDFAAAAWVVRDARRLGGDGGDGASSQSSSALFASSDDDEEEGDSAATADNIRPSFSLFRPKKPRHFPCAVSVVLCFMAGPLGILSHLLTRRIWYRMGWAIERVEGGTTGEEEGGEVAPAATAAPAPALSTF